MTVLITEAHPRQVRPRIEEWKEANVAAVPEMKSCASKCGITLDKDF